MDNKTYKEITKEKLEKYFGITEKALDKAKKAVMGGRKKDAQEIISMAENYLSDATFFQKKGDYINAFAAINYAHGWLDSGARLGIFDVEDNKLFTIK